MKIDYADRRQKACERSTRMLEHIRLGALEGVVQVTHASEMVPAGISFHTEYCSSGLVIYNSLAMEFWSYAVAAEGGYFEPDGDSVYAPSPAGMTAGSYKELRKHLKGLYGVCQRHDQAVPKEYARKAVEQSNKFAKRISRSLLKQNLSFVQIDAELYRPASVRITGEEKSVLLHTLSHNHLVMRHTSVSECECGCGAVSFVHETHNCPYKDGGRVSDEELDKLAVAIRKDLAEPIVQKGGTGAAVVLIL